MDSSSSLSSDFKFRACAALVALGVAAFLVVCFWRLYWLTVSARPQDMMPISSSSTCAGAGKAALTQRDISALPVFVHAGADVTVECAVCLAHMRDGERGRLLPGCGHRFHVDCIDRWFRANSTCPLCRAAAVSEPGGVKTSKVGSVAVPVVVVQG